MQQLRASFKNEDQNIEPVKREVTIFLPPESARQA
jgi:hypothetical protein